MMQIKQVGRVQTVLDLFPILMKIIQGGRVQIVTSHDANNTNNTGRQSSDSFRPVSYPYENNTGRHHTGLLFQIPVF
jgi:hypothetical protein